MKPSRAAAKQVRAIEDQAAAIDLLNEQMASVLHMLTQIANKVILGEEAPVLVDIEVEPLPEPPAKSTKASK